ncbi:MAG: double-strand break repair helicase AddA [Pseudomonadota bacterium]
MTRRDSATEAQIRAGRPDRSSWVSANAGSGKTRVLTDRVARLLLHGVDPQRILCLTYTKAAAGEMQNRLFQRLGQWSMLPDTALRTALGTLDEARLGISDRDLARARTLFARALEAPGGLKIQTIHAFCETQLRRFPLEAGVVPGFQVLEERGAARLRMRVLDELAGKANGGFDRIAPYLSRKDLALAETLAEIIRHRDRLVLAPSSDTVIRAFGLNAPVPDLTTALSPHELDALIAGISTHGGTTEKKALAAIRALRTGANDSLEQLSRFFVNAEGGPKTQHLGTKALTAIVPNAPEHMQTLAQAVSDTLDHQRTVAALEQTQALLEFAQGFVPAYDAAKQSLGVLEFDDMIRATDSLLSQSDAADWVRYRLDGGIHHLLVDEAQDTSPAQWRVIDALTQEFFAGAGTTDRARTVFVVGDSKQSIYSFQGADPAAFGAQEQRYSDALTDADEALERCDLLHSFRSAAPILEVVDQTFAALPGIATADHLAFKSELPGRVELWPWQEKDPDAPDSPWDDPVDYDRSGSATSLLAGKLADWIADKLERHVELPGSGRAVAAGDFLILVRSRGTMFRAILSALAAAKVPVAGADRLRVNDQLIVKDLLGLLCAINTESDDLNFAAALRSPLFQLSEQDLFSLAHGRDGTLIRSLETRAEDFPMAWEIVDDLRRTADYLRPFELLNRILIRHGAAGRVAARLGPEAMEAVDALLDLALEYERSEPPSLTGFLAWMSQGNPEVKRQLDAGTGEVRVMTVHGAKGLEAPVVILPDTGNPSDANNDALIPLGADLATLKVTNEQGRPRVLREASAQRKALDAEERWRLLYVAMTRAEQWLVVAGAGETPREGSWYAAVQQALESCGAADATTGNLVQQHRWSPGTLAKVPTGAVHVPSPPPWVTSAPPAPVNPEAPILPSRDGADFLPGTADEISTGAPRSPAGAETARREGLALHRLLERLPGLSPGEWDTAARGLLSALEDTVPEHTWTDLISAARRLITTPALSWMFAAGALTEVPVAGRVAGLAGRLMRGQIDRLVITDHDVWIIDYKSNAHPPRQLPAAIAGQLALYAVAMAEVYPEHRIRAGVLWTTTGGFSELHHDAVSVVLQSGTTH